MTDKNYSFYEYCNLIVNEYNNNITRNQYNNQLVDISSKYNINITDVIISYNGKNNCGIHTKNVDFFVTQSFYEFLNSLNYNVNIPNSVGIIKQIMFNLFTGGFKTDIYINLYNKFLYKIKDIKESTDGYIIINSKQPMKLGKFISTIIKLLELNIDNVDISHGIEQFIDEYKSWYDKSNKLQFVVLKGDDILKGYNYNHQYQNYSSLNKSCMNNRPQLLKLYTDNEDKVLMLTLQRDNKIYGRCLIWNLDKPKIIYMDRVYGVDNYIDNIFLEFAKKNKWSFRFTESLKKFIIYTYNHKKQSYIYEYSSFINYKVKLKTSNIKKFPYMDSFKINNVINNYFYMNNNYFFMMYNTLRSLDGEIKKSLNLFGIKLF